MQERYDNDVEEFSIGDESVEVKDRTSGERGGGFKKKVIYVVLVAIGFFFTYKFFAGNADKDKELDRTFHPASEEKVIDTKEVKKSEKSSFILPKDDDVNHVLLPPKLPELPKLPPMPLPQQPEAPTAERSAPALPSFLPPGTPSGSSPMDPPTKVVAGGKYRYDRTTPMLVFGGGGAQSPDGESSGINFSDPSSMLDPSKLGDLRKSLQQTDTTPLEDKALQRTQNQTVATYLGNLDYVLAEGKMLDAVLETAINTDLQAKVRAVVSRDVFSESGNLILIPRGSRLIGSYSSDISFNQSRVNIVWTRIILPNGIDITLGNFAGVDPLGRAGVRGVVNSKVSNVMSTSILLATARVASGIIVDRIMGADKKLSEVTVSTPKRPLVKKNDDVDDDGSKAKGSAGAIIGIQAVQDASKQVTDYVKRMANANPTITINQGAKLKVFVDQDIVFPKSSFQEYKVLE
ncbi:bacterial conjugation TrbI-like family protein [Neorickettsia helminthoeca str. Oregon]|uniref:Bacterial conjugation TrbI-like family protein n=1 Tax=Neorickettsia helminthoeca str. Oregon TaxID=1286528 RepID=X5H4Y9_9RICK|nr:TrbI/VirB10 family protein [Neorickettsia helminthoeca]AHX11636.1 bacterial conjugation TrbI-like family protein [Neorickettsia helminthoeca str. Oregon]